MKTVRLLLTGSLSIALIAMTLIFVARARAEEPRTQTVFTQTGEGANVIPYLRRGGKEVLFVDLEDTKDFDNVSLNFTYISGGTMRGVISNTNPQTKKVDGSFGGKDYIRVRIDLATCSNKVCVYHSDGGNKLKDFKLTVTSRNPSAKVKEVIRVLTIPN
ncbi:MAG: hypothetical protein Q8R11_04300 [bacterium]|nr:hypothetical protein [bacterium]